MLMKKIQPLVFLVLLYPWASQAITISAIPSGNTFQVGNGLSVDIAVSDFGNGIAPTLGAYSFDLIYDPAILAATGQPVFDAFLGDTDPFAFQTDIAVDSSTAGVIGISVLSFLTSAELDAIQPADFALATISFAAIGAGSSVVDFSSVVLTDAASAQSFLGVVQQGTVVQVNPNSGGVPLPGTLLLMLALIPLVVRRKYILG